MPQQRVDKKNIFMMKEHENDFFTCGEYTYATGEMPRPRYRTGKEKLKIGRFCSIAQEVIFFMGGNHRLDWVSTYPFNGFREIWPEATEVNNFSRGDIVIGNDVWIGYGASIFSGLTIGDGAVIGAHAVVTKDVPPYAIVAGNPARILRYRFDEQTIAKLLELKWWDWPEQKINENMALLCSPNLNALFEKHLAKEKLHAAV